MSTKYTVRVRCSTWDALESFYSDRIRPGGLLGARVPFVPQRGDQVTVALELPDGIVFAIDGVVRELGATQEEKTPIMLRLIGFDAKSQERLEEMVWEGRKAAAEKRASQEVETVSVGDAGEGTRPPPPTPQDAPIDLAVPVFRPPTDGDVSGEVAELLEHLRTELARLRELGARQVIGVPMAAAAKEVRTAYFELVRQFHPDVVARHHSPALSHAASELSIYVNRAYDRVRSAVRAAGGTSIAGPAMRPELGWLIDIEDLALSTSGQSRDVSTPGFRVRLVPAKVSTRIPMPGPLTTPSPRTRTAPLTADALFDDLSEAGTASGQTSLTSGSLETDEATSSGELRELIAEAANAAGRGELEESAKLYAEAVALDPRDRKLRARYHSTRGRQLLESGERVRATTQLELALTHDPDSREAQAALTGLKQVGARKKRRFSGWFRR